LANHKSAIKRQKQSEAKKLINKATKTLMRTKIKKVRTAVEELKADAAQEALKEAIKPIIKAAQKGAIHKKTASRKVSRLTKAVNRAKAQSAKTAK
jgi:small subunit ribosomal protein S20